ncbi:MAG: glycosyltransferase, partial [Nostocaceae cyanobacterium]|nr:glycosyltransferase [Nostocaceae cyanobacterium]
MTHFGIICPAAIGHLNPMCALGKELQRRGHRVTLFQIPDIESKVKATGLDFHAIGSDEFPPGKLAQIYKQLGENSGLSALRLVVSFLLEETVMQLRVTPEALKQAGVEALLVDQVSPGGGTIADFLNLPFITVCNALLVNREEGVPPYFSNWGYSTTWWARLRNRAGNYLLDRISQPIRNVVIEQRYQWKLPPYIHWEDSGSPLAQICQLPPEFDFPRVNL